MANSKDNVLLVAKALHLQHNLTKEFRVAWPAESDDTRKLFIREADDLVTILEAANKGEPVFVVLAKEVESAPWEGVFGWKADRQENELAVIMGGDDDRDALYRCDRKEATRIIHHLSKYGQYREIKIVEM
jgi:hypothetical protein